MLTKIRTARWLFAIPVTGLDRPWEFQEVEAPIFRDNQHMQVARLLAPRTSRLYASENISDTHLLEVESTLGPQCGRKDCQWKIPMTPSGIDPATFRQNQDCTYINNGNVFYKVSFKKYSPWRNASEPIKNSAFNKGWTWRTIHILTRVYGMYLITPTFLCVLVCNNHWKVTWPWDLCSTRPFDQSQRESSPAVLLQRARWRIWSAATRYRLRAPGACLNGLRKSSLTKVRNPNRPHRIQPLIDYVIPVAIYWR